MSQREMPLLGDIKRDLEEVPHRLIVACKNKQEAIALCVKWSGLQLTYLSHALEIDKGNLSRMLTGSAHFPPKKENLLQDVCGNEAILDWSNWSRGKKAIPIDNSEKIAALEAQLKQLQEVG